jgi:hypothetical protein
LNFQVGDRVQIVGVGDWGNGIITGISRNIYYTVRTDSGVILELAFQSMKLLPEKVRFT